MQWFGHFAEICRHLCYLLIFCHKNTQKNEGLSTAIGVDCYSDEAELRPFDLWDNLFCKEPSCWLEIICFKGQPEL